MDEKVKDWLLEDNSWLKFAVENQLLGKKADPSLATSDSKIQAIINRLKDSNLGIPALKSGKVAYTSTGNAFWDLFFLSDIGLRVEDIDIQDEIKYLFELQLEDGTFILQEGTKSGYLCIPTIILASLVKMGCDNDPHILQFIEKIFETQRLDGARST